MEEKPIVNDQGDIIVALSKQQYAYVWKRVRACGYNTIANINDRYSIFCDCIDTFDYTKNNNFIKYYKDHLKYAASYNNKTFYVTSNRAIVKKLKNENISPTDDCYGSVITRELKNWSN